MKRLPLAMAIAALAMTPAAYAQGPLPTAPNAADEAKIDALIAPVLTAIKTGKAAKATTAFMTSNPIAATKVTEMEYFGMQVDSALSVYGPASNCQLVEKVSRSSFDQSRLYVCPSPKAVTRWVFRVGNMTGGWAALLLYFDDKAFKGLDDCGGACGG